MWKGEDIAKRFGIPRMPAIPKDACVAVFKRPISVPIPPENDPMAPKEVFWERQQTGRILSARFEGWLNDFNYDYPLMESSIHFARDRIAERFQDYPMRNRFELIFSKKSFWTIGGRLRLIFHWEEVDYFIMADGSEERIRF